VVSKRNEARILAAFAEMNQGRVTNETGRAIYDVIKEIDNYSGPGTFTIFSQRVDAYYNFRVRQIFYEPLSTYDSMLEACLINARLADQYVPEWALYGLTVSFQVFESAYTAPFGRLPIPASGDAPKGFHAVSIIGYDDHGEALTFQNSWGTAWGNKGFGTLTRQYAERYMNDAWLGRNARVGPTAFNYSRLNQARDNRDFARTWMLENPRWQKRFRHRSLGHQLVNYEALSVAEACRVDVVELRLGTGVRVGWALVFHLLKDNKPTSIIKELYVWPTSRRLGYGRILEETACDLARLRRSEQIEVLFHEADALLPVRAAGRRFGQHQGYTWMWRRHERPGLVAIGRKAL